MTLLQAIGILFVLSLGEKGNRLTPASAFDTYTDMFGRNHTDSVTDPTTKDHKIIGMAFPLEGTENDQVSIPMTPCEMKCTLQVEFFIKTPEYCYGKATMVCKISSYHETDNFCVASISTFFMEYLEYLEYRSSTESIHPNYVLDLQCASPVHVHIQDHNDDPDNNRDLKRLRDIMVYLILTNCDMHWGDIAKFGNIVDLRVLYLTNRVDTFTKEISDSSSIFYENITHMDGNSETIKKLPPGLQNIVTLSLSSSGRGQGHRWAEIFLRYQWSQLAEMFLRNMTVQEVPEDLARSMPNLQAIVVHHERYITSPPSYFPWNNQIRKIPKTLCRTKTFHNPGDRYLRIIHWQNGNLQNMSNFKLRGNVDKFEMTYSKVTRISRDLFKNSKDVEHIDLSHNKLVLIPDGIFHGLHNLIYLNLDSNLLDSLPFGTFRNLTKLKELHLEGNMLTNIGSQTFYHLRALEQLDISHNNLQYIARDAISLDSDTIIEIQASHNHLKFVPVWALLLRNAKKINFSYNQIDFVHFHALISAVDFNHLVYQNRQDTAVVMWQILPTGQKDLNLGHNNFTTIRYQDFNSSELQVFEGLIHFYNVDLEGNPLLCDCDLFPLFQFLNSNKTKSSHFNKFNLQNWRCAMPAHLADEAVRSVKEGDYRCPVKIKYCPEPCICYNRTVDGLIEVDCSYSNLTKLPKILPPNAEHLILRENSLSVLSEPPLYLQQLQVLNLSYNDIKSISAAFVKAIASIETVQLDHNKLAYYPNQFQSQELGTKSLTIGNNPIRCDCHSTWVKDWLLRHRKVIKDIDNVRCASGNAPQVILVEVPLEDFICEAVQSEIYRNVVITLCVAVAVMILVVKLLYMYRGEIKVLLYVHFNWHPFDKHDDDDTDKLYDAFVSYSAQDYKWVCHVLRRRLEAKESGNYKLCLHDRDFMVGAPIHDNIMDAVNKSRRMILVLSRNFVQSDWCMLEFRTAHLKAMKDKIQYLIIIFYDDIPETELDEDLKLYIRTNTYLSIHNKCFWEKLSYAMPQTPIMVLRPELPKPQQLTYSESQSDTGCNTNINVQMDSQLQQARWSRDTNDGDILTSDRPCVLENQTVISS